MYHIQISIYVKADSIHGAKAVARVFKNVLENNTSFSESIDEVVIDAVGIEQSNQEPTES